MTFPSVKELLSHPEIYQPIFKEQKKINRPYLKPFNSDWIEEKKREKEVEEFRKIVNDDID